MNRFPWWEWLLTRTRALEQKYFHSLAITLYRWLVYAFHLLSHPYTWFYPFQQPFYAITLITMFWENHNNHFAGPQFGTNRIIILCHINSFWQTSEVFSCLFMCHLSQARTLVYVVINNGMVFWAIQCINYATYYSKSPCNIGRYYNFVEIIGLITYKKTSSFLLSLIADFRIQLIPPL